MIKLNFPTKNDDPGEIKDFLIELARSAEAQDDGRAARDALIDEINAYLDELQGLAVERERIDFETIPDRDLPDLLDAVWQQVLRRKSF